MNLHRQIAVAIEVLEEQRKPALRSMMTQQLVAPCCHQLVQRCSRKRTIGYDGLYLLVVGCSAFKEKVVPTLNAEVTPGNNPAPQAAAKYSVEIRPDKGQPLAVEKELTDQMHVQAALDQSGALKKFKRAHVKLFRPLTAGGWHKMNLEFDKENHRIPPEYDY